MGKRQRNSAVTTKTAVKNGEKGGNGGNVSLSKSEHFGAKRRLNDEKVVEKGEKRCFLWQKWA